MIEKLQPIRNPFSTRFIRPGAIGYRFPEGLSSEILLKRLESCGWWGQILGPHGSGKSTLLATLIPALESRQSVVKVALHEDRRDLPISVWSLPLGTLLVVDGYELLGWWSRRRLQRLCRDRRCGLLITAHQDLGLPNLISTKVSSDLARAVIDGFLTSNHVGLFDHLDLETCLVRHQGSMREILFELYDQFECQVRQKVK